MKKLLAVIFALIFSLSLVSCAKDVEKEVFFSEETLASLNLKTQDEATTE